METNGRWRVLFFFSSRKIQKFKNTKKREKRGPHAQRAKEPFLNLDAAGALRWTTPFRMGRMILEMTAAAAAAMGKAVYSGQQRNTGRVWWGGVVIFRIEKRKRERESGDNS